MSKNVRYELIKRNINWNTTLGELSRHLKFNLLERLSEKAFENRSPKMIDYNNVEIGRLLISYTENVVESFEDIFNNLKVEDFKRYSLGEIIEE